MSLGQREFGNIFNKGENKEMSNRHIEIKRDANSKITVTEYLISGAGIQPFPSIIYQPAKIKFVAGRCMVIESNTSEELYDCRYEDCIIKRV
jgi:hypothetical protein